MAGDLNSIRLFHAQAGRAIQLVVVLAFVQASLVPRASCLHVLLAQDGLRARMARSMGGVIGLINIVVTAKHGQFLRRQGSDCRC